MVKAAARKKGSKKTSRKNPKPSLSVVSESEGEESFSNSSSNLGADREIVYDSIEMQLYDESHPLTVKHAKEYLGWQEEGGNIKFGARYLLKDDRGIKIRCSNNNRNRPFEINVAQTLKQEILRRNWQLNLETIIIGCTGLILSGQHRLIALILASQTWEKQPGKWIDYWQNEPYITVLVACGASEEDKVVNTLDTAKPRTLAHVLYRSEILADSGNKDRKQIARICDYGVRLLWHRTGASLSSFSSKRTHSESIGFIQRHPKLIDAAKHIYTEYCGDPLNTRRYSPGYAAALLYMMGSSKTDSTEYQNMQDPTEYALDWSLWDTACDFWTLLAGGDRNLIPLRHALNAVISDRGSNLAERTATIVKAWHCYSTGKPVTAKALQLSFIKDDDGINVLDECPSVGGIDLGNPKEAIVVSEDHKEPKLSSKKTGKKKKFKKTKLRIKSGTTQPNTIGSRNGDAWVEGDTAWAVDGDLDPFFGTLIEDPYITDTDEERVTLQELGTDQKWDVLVSSLSIRYPK